MNILVLGGTRYMGKHLVKELLFKGYNVTIATRGITADDFEDKITRLIIDRTYAESLKNGIPDVIYDIVFDSLAYSSNEVKNLLDIVKCKKYVQISTASVYFDIHLNTKEDEFDPYKKPLVWCDRTDFDYGEVKCQAECCIVQEYSHIPSVRIRFPYVIGPDDYTKRLYFYVEHIINQKPMFIDNLKAQMAFVRSDEAGKFVAFFADNNFTGAINGSSQETISLEQIITYVNLKTGLSPILTNLGEEAPYNGSEDFSLDISKSQDLGFAFTPLSGWIYELIDLYIKQAGFSQ